MQAANSVERDMSYLCTTLGRRLAGWPEERQAADYVAERFREEALSHVEVLPFPVRRWHPAPARLTVAEDGRRIELAQITHSPATPEGGVEGDLVILEPFDYMHGLRRGDLAGKIGLFHGFYGECPDRYRALHESGLRALLFVDTRLPTAWPIANGMGERFMQLTRLPMAVISLMDAYALARDRVRRVRVECGGHVEEAESWNVIGEQPGTRPDGRVIVVSGHLDTVSAGVGADDNASGMAAVLECARRLRGARLTHTIRYVGFGAEEQLSVGSTRYVGTQARDLERVGFACNFDGIGACLGLSTLLVTGTKDLEAYCRERVEVAEGWGWVEPGVSPYQDMFPFAARGIPGVWFRRRVHEGGRWFFHSEHDNLAVVSPEVIARTAGVAADLVGDLARRDTWPFPRALDPDLAAECRAFSETLF